MKKNIKIKQTPKDSMKNIKNLKPVRTKEEARKRGKNGGIKSGEVRRKRRTLKEELLLLLSDKDTQEKISLAIIEQAKIGNIKAYETIRDTIGEKPIDKVETDIDFNIRVELDD